MRAHAARAVSGAWVMTTGAAQAVRRRSIGKDDLPAIIDLLCEGFAERPRRYWEAGLGRLAIRDAPESYPKFGYMLECAGEAVGVILLIFSHTDDDRSRPVRCNLSSWYVRPAFRAYATLLTAAASGLKEVTYINSSAAGYTWPILESQGFVRYGRGQFVAIPALGLSEFGAPVRRVRGAADAAGLGEAELLVDHARSGCVSLICRSSAGEAPFVFVRWRLRGRPGMFRLLWCRDTADFVRCAGPIGRFLLRQGVALVAMDAIGAVPGLAGRYFAGAQPKFFRGPAPPRLNDLAFTETMIFGA